MPVSDGLSTVVTAVTIYFFVKKFKQKNRLS